MPVVKEEVNFHLVESRKKSKKRGNITVEYARFQRLRCWKTFFT